MSCWDSCGCGLLWGAQVGMVLGAVAAEYVIGPYYRRPAVLMAKVEAMYEALAAAVRDCLHLPVGGSCSLGWCRLLRAGVLAHLPVPHAGAHGQEEEEAQLPLLFLNAEQAVAEEVEEQGRVEDAEVRRNAREARHLAMLEEKVCAKPWAELAATGGSGRVPAFWYPYRDITAYGTPMHAGQGGAGQGGGPCGFGRRGW